MLRSVLSMREDQFKSIALLGLPICILRTHSNVMSPPHSHSYSVHYLPYSPSTHSRDQSQLYPKPAPPILILCPISRLPPSESKSRPTISLHVMIDDFILTASFVFIVESYPRQHPPFEQETSWRASSLPFKWAHMQPMQAPYTSWILRGAWFSGRTSCAKSKIPISHRTGAAPRHYTIGGAVAWKQSGSTCQAGNRPHP